MANFKLPRKAKKKYKKDNPIFYNCSREKERWEWFYFRRRVEVRCMEVILTYPEYNKETGKYEFDPKLAKPATNEQLLAYFKKHYPNDKLSHHFCRQNRHRWDKFNSNV